MATGCIACNAKGQRGGPYKTLKTQETIASRIRDVSPHFAGKVKNEHTYIYYKIRCMQQGLNLRCSIRRTDYESVAFDHSAMHAVAILSIKTINCKNLKDRKWHTVTVDKFIN